jgi:hypothetical protein
MNTPNNLEECFTELERQFGEDMVTAFRDEKEEDLPKYHFGTGMGIRNGWGLWTGSHLAKYFEEMGIFHPDDMSAIILTSFHRRLNNKDVRLDEQREYFARYWINMGEKGGDVSDWDRKYFTISQRQWRNIQPKGNDRSIKKLAFPRWRLSTNLRSAIREILSFRKEPSGRDS